MGADQSMPPASNSAKPSRVQKPLKTAQAKPSALVASYAAAPQTNATTR